MPLVDTLVDQNDLLGQRIREIMDEKGKAYSVRALYKKIGCKNHMELQRYLDGTNVIPPAVLGRIAEVLKLDVSRIEMTDTREKVEELKALLASGEQPRKALQIASCLSYIAVGSSERVDALRNLGQAQYDLRNYELALQSWGKAYQIARTGRDLHRLYCTVNDYAHAMLVLKDYTSMMLLLEESETAFSGNPEKYGRLKHLRGICYYDLGDFKQAKRFFIDSHNAYMLSGNVILIGRMQINLGHLAFKEGDYSWAKKYLSQAYELLRDDTVVMRATVAKDLARVLILQNEFRSAYEIIKKHLTEMTALSIENPELIGKLSLMLAELEDDPNLIAWVLYEKATSRSLKCNAADFLLRFYLQQGDNDRALKYYRLVKEYSNDMLNDYRKGDWF